MSQLQPQRLFNTLQHTLKHQNGILLSKQCLVNRITFTGRNVLGHNDSIDPKYKHRTDQDHRGYVPVESWILSHTETVNAIPIKNEGISQLRLLSVENKTNQSEESVYFNQLLSNLDCKNLLFGPDFDLNQWPLIKILDIGGNKVYHNDELESPPIPCHVHNGIIDSKTGQHILPAKDEAYFFPPPPDFAKANIDKDEIVYSRLGVKPEVDEKIFVKAMKEWGMNSDIYDLLNKYELEVNTGWTIFSGIVHSPGPILTLEIQRALDDYNLLAWHLGKNIEDKEELEMFKRQHLFKDSEYVINHKDGGEQFIFDQLIDWELSRLNEKDFEYKYKRNRLLIDKGEFGEYYQIFFDIFYGEALHIKPGMRYTVQSQKGPFCGVTWNGKGLVNGNNINSMDDNCREFLVANNETASCAKTEFENNNDSDQDLVVYLLYPLQE